jgi:heat shock protein HspQ
MAKFSIGDRVIHKVFGEGDIVDIDTGNSDKLTKNFMYNPVSNGKFCHYLFLLMYAITTKIANMMMTIICTDN